MAYIHITFAGVSSANQILRDAVGEAIRLEEALVGLVGTVDPEIQSRYEIGERIRTCQQAAREISKEARGILHAAELGLLEYRKLEARLNREVPADDGILR